MRLNSISTDIASVTLPNLIVVGQDLYLADVASETKLLSFPSLVNVTGKLTLDNIHSETVDVPSLRNVGGTVYCISPGSRLKALNFPALENVGGNFQFSLIYYVLSINASALQTVGGDVYLYDSRNGLTELSFESLKFVGGPLQILSFNNLVAAYFNSLTSVGSSGSTTYCEASDDYEQVCINDATALETISFRSLDYDSFDVGIAAGH